MDSLFITFEGKDGGGKSTRAMDLKRRLESKGKKVYLKHFPSYESPIGGFIGEYLKGKHGDIDFKSLQMLYVADQLSFQEELERLLFDENTVVICDRYDMSTIAYYVSKTGCTVDEGVDLIKNHWQVELRKPDVTFVMNFEGDLDKRRAKSGKEKDKIENDDIITNSIGEIYKNLAHRIESVGRGVYIIDGNQSEKHNSDYIYKVIESESLFTVKYDLDNRNFKNEVIKPFF